MMSRYIANPLNPDGHYSLAGPIVRDPIFTPLFLSMGFSGAGILGTSITAAGIASAIATTSLTPGVQIR